jgi:hypothetical protein
MVARGIVDVPALLEHQRLDRRSDRYHLAVAKGIVLSQGPSRNWQKQPGKAAEFNTE